MISIAALKSYIQGLQQADPRLYDVLSAIIDRLSQVEIDYQELHRQLTERVQEIVSEAVSPVQFFDYILSPDFVTLTWEKPESTDPIVAYEIRKGGTSWETASKVTITTTLSALLNPLPVGTHKYRIKSIGQSGNFSVQDKTLDILIPEIGAPNTDITVIDNNVLIYWTAPQSVFRISHYIIKRNNQVVGTKDGTFTSYFERDSGTYEYSVAAVDVAGNVGQESKRDAIVNQPPDYVLHDVHQSDFSGTKIYCMISSPGKLLFNTAEETWEYHFAARGWNTLQEKIDSGYPYYMQPSRLLGTYLEVIDYGTVLSGVVATVSWAYQTLSGQGNDFIIQMRTSLDNSNWTPWVMGASQYLSNFRYLQISFSTRARD